MEHLREICKFLKTLVDFLLCRRDRLPKRDPKPWDPPFDPSQPSPPISYPITSLEALASRSYLRSYHFPFNRASVPLPSSAAFLPPRRRILVCHDMKGGYVDDLRVQGSGNPGAYAIWHWYLMDVFVYFSHDLVTLPPPCWTNAAHTHGVKVLGTFLVEWDEGRVICDTLLSSKESSQMYAERLTELASALGFDGWLVNIEVNLDKKQVNNLKEFVHHLSCTMHSSVPGSLVIWYDAVTIDGKLAWQNKLNDANKPFFDLCDGIFVNYTWQEGYPKVSAVNAGNRRLDVYMGIDVFGRNTFGGGEWNSNVALDALKKDDVSAAIFAPAWVYETNQKPDFQTAHNCWWGLVEQSWGILQHYPKELPFFSDFDQGHGYHFSIEGFQVAKDPWNNISSQGFQPILGNPVNHNSSSTIEAFINFKDASYSGGGNITAKGSLMDNSFFSAKLFHGQLLLDDQPVYISYSVKVDENSLFGLHLELLSETNGRTCALIASDSESFTNAGLEYNIIIKPQIKSKVEDALAYPPWFIHEAVLTLGDYTLAGIYMVCTLKSRGLITIQNNKSSSQEGTLPETSGSSLYYASLGHISIRNKEDGTEYPPADLWVTRAQNILCISDSLGNKMLNLKLTWKLNEGSTTSFQRYNIYAQSGSGLQYLGLSRAEAFYVSDLSVYIGVTTLRFIIQVRGLDGTCQKLAESPYLDLTLED
ncbi:cytosolic endo-beta-N-acetylglucosaminidase 1-like [Zingiber officinale]|uniref:cytosolic endo-beta-N-acetylglucosaminidase 1-like n=1 Tax=Zingiber officinale TaxID=94328 RepID=UPI001C4C4432|nr:cytosolic endo-beta-N-acetylglucosaminidase 1-like [Zingiber officinale]